jgi:hypothetical protein
MAQAGVYPLTPEITRWLDNNLWHVEPEAHYYWAKARPVMDIAIQAANGEIPEWVADDVLRRYNAANDCGFTLAGLCDSAASGIDAVSSDQIDYSQRLYTDDPQTAVSFGADDLWEVAEMLEGVWSILVLHDEGVVVVFCSPYIEEREAYESCMLGDVGDGLCLGDCPTYVLPPEAEALYLEGTDGTPFLSHMEDTQGRAEARGSRGPRVLSAQGRGLMGHVQVHR